jgi:hypothetical protein
VSEPPLQITSRPNCVVCRGGWSRGFRACPLQGQVAPKKFFLAVTNVFCSSYMRANKNLMTYDAWPGSNRRLYKLMDTRYRCVFFSSHFLIPDAFLTGSLVRTCEAPMPDGVACVIKHSVGRWTWS